MTWFIAIARFIDRQRELWDRHVDVAYQPCPLHWVPSGQGWRLRGDVLPEYHRDGWISC